jgi:hypothetical protein
MTYPIRKIVVGPDYKDGMHFQVDQEILKGSHKIQSITLDSYGVYRVWIEDTDNGVKLWKQFDKTPVSVEYSIDY